MSVTKARIARALSRKGWNVLGGPAEEWDGVAVKGNAVVVVDVSATSPIVRRSGVGVSYPALETYGPCTDCDGSGRILKTQQSIIIEVDDEEFMLQDEKRAGDICMTCKGSGYTWESRGRLVAEPWPEFQPNPERTLWHVEKDGAIRASGSFITERTILRKIDSALQEAN